MQYSSKIYIIGFGIIIGFIIIGPAIAANSVKASPIYPVYSEMGKHVYFIDFGCAYIDLNQLTTTELDYHNTIQEDNKKEEFFSSPIEITDNDLVMIHKINHLIEQTHAVDFESDYDISLSPAELDDHKRYLEDKFTEQYPEKTMPQHGFLIQHNKVPYSIGFSQCGF